MALRNQPYLPLYVQDYLTDEKLNMCSASSQGVYIKIMCIMHKSEKYGKILLKQKDKQTTKQIENFANKLAKLLPFPFDTIKSALVELLDEQVLYMENDELCQKRMIKDESISFKRSLAGSKGGKITQFAKAKQEANSENEDENENENINAIEEDKEKDDVVRLFISTWSRSYSNLSEMQGAERLILEFGYDNVKNAFRIAGENNKTTIGYVRGILNKEKEKNTPKKPYGNSQIMNELYGKNGH